MKALVAGATGLVGTHLVAGLLAASHAVVTVGRREAGDARAVSVVAEFTALPPLPEADVALCALGTTLARAGSRAAFRAIDHDAVLAFATAAHAAGAARFVLVTSVGADARAAAFYARVKGEVERSVSMVGFERLDILQPGLLLGARDERRPVEALLQRSAPLLSPLLRGSLARYGAIEAEVVARAAVTLVSASGGGVFRHDNTALRALG